MKWEKISALCIASGPWLIFRYNFAIPEYFELWRGGEFQGRYATSAEAKEVAEMEGKAA